MEFREFLIQLEKRGYLKKVTKNVNWKYEIGEIARANKYTPLLFTDIEEYAGCRLFTNGLCRTGFLAMSVGMEICTKKGELIKQLKRRIANPIEPVTEKYPNEYMASGSKGVNLFELPVPWWNHFDGGRYIGTWHLNITNDPVTGKRNVGVYRMQIKSLNQTTVSVSPDSHLAVHVRNAEKIGKDLEMAVAIGVNEVSIMAAAAALPFGVDEFSIAGAIQRNPIKLIPCRAVNVEVPYEAEYILEGKIKNGVRVTDGPYMDYSGKASVNPSAYLFEIINISKRVNPIFRGMSVGEPGAEDHQLFSLLSHLNLVHFHGSTVRQKIQNLFLKYRMFSFFQYSGRLGSLLQKVS